MYGIRTDFPYVPFFPEGVPVVQVDVRGEQIGRRVRLVGTVRDTAAALLPLLGTRTDTAHLDGMTAHYRRGRLDRLARPGRDGAPLHPQHIAPPSTGSPPRTRCSVDQAGDLEDALRAAFDHDGPALVDVSTARQELALPPKITYGQLAGFTPYATRTIVSGGGAELIELSRTNLRQLETE